MTCNIWWVGWVVGGYDSDTISLWFLARGPCGKIFNCPDFRKSVEKYAKHNKGEYLCMLIVSAMFRYGNSKKSEDISHKAQSKQFRLCGCWNPWSMQTRTDSNFPKQFLDSVRRIMRRALWRPPLQNIHDSPLFKRTILCDLVDTSQIYGIWSLLPVGNEGCYAV